MPLPAPFTAIGTSEHPSSELLPSLALTLVRDVVHGYLRVRHRPSVIGRSAPRHQSLGFQASHQPAPSQNGDLGFGADADDSMSHTSMLPEALAFPPDSSEGLPAGPSPMSRGARADSHAPTSPHFYPPLVCFATYLHTLNHTWNLHVR